MLIIIERLKTPTRQEAFRELVYRISTNFRRRRKTTLTLKSSIITTTTSKDNILSIHRDTVKPTTPEIDNKTNEFIIPSIPSSLKLRINDMLIIIRKDRSKRVMCSLRDIIQPYLGTDEVLD